MARKKAWDKQDYVHRALSILCVKMLRKGNEGLISEIGEFFMALLPHLDNDKASRVDALEEDMREVKSVANLLATANGMERSN